MKRQIRRIWWLAIIVVCATIVALTYYSKKKPIASWHCPRMNEIERQWLSVWEIRENTPPSQMAEKYGLKNEKFIKMLREVFIRNLSAQDLRQLASLSAELPVRAQDRSGFDNALLRFMVEAFLTAADRDSLGKLMSTRFPDDLGPSEILIEYCLASRGKTLKDTILILGEAYSMCQDTQVRHHLAIVVRRAFIGSGIEGKDDDEFVKNAMQWYQKEKEHLILNLGYGGVTPPPSYDLFPDAYEKVPSLGRSEWFDRSRVWARFEKNPLFVEKSSVDESKETK